MSDKPRPLIEIAIEPLSGIDQSKLGPALVATASEDPDFTCSVDRESGQTILSGNSEAHLERILARFKNELRIGIKAGRPQVSYRETVTGPADVDHTYKKLIGSAGEFARVIIHVEPLPAGGGFLFESGSAPLASYLPGIERGVQVALESGVLGGFPVIDIRVRLTDGAYHDIDSSKRAFEIATRAAMKEALSAAGPILLEPVMRVEVVTPRDCMGDVVGDLNSRRGRVTGQDQRGNAEVISALVPLANLFGYPKTLESMTHGRATHEMRFSHYAPTPPAEPDDPTFRPAMGMRA